MELHILTLSFFAAVFMENILKASLAVYPSPGSFYSVLLRYNNRGKTRKEARIAPSPSRLWGYFDPPAILGSLPLKPVDNSIVRDGPARTRGRKTEDNHLLSKKFYKDNLNLAPTETSLYRNSSEALKSEEHLEINSKTTAETIDNLRFEKYRSENNGNFRRHEQSKKNSKKPLQKSEEELAKASALSKAQEKVLNGTCGGSFKVSLSPSLSKNRKNGRYFHESIQNIGFPNSYEADSNCKWTVEINEKCQMGSIWYHVHDGNILSSPNCSADSLRISFNGQEEQRFCGSMKGKSGTQKWAKSGSHNLTMTFESGAREEPLDAKKIFGFKITLSAYCYIYSTAHLSKIKRIDYKNNLINIKKEKTKITHDSKHRSDYTAYAHNEKEVNKKGNGIDAKEVVKKGASNKENGINTEKNSTINKENGVNKEKNSTINKENGFKVVNEGTNNKENDINEKKDGGDREKGTKDKINNTDDKGKNKVENTAINIKEKGISVEKGTSRDNEEKEMPK